MQRSLTPNALGLMILTLLALGVFVSGLNLRAWKLCVTGAFLAISVPTIAWLQDAALLLVLVGIVLIALLFGYWWLRDRLNLQRFACLRNCKVAPVSRRRNFRCALQGWCDPFSLAAAARSTSQIAGRSAGRIA